MSESLADRLEDIRVASRVNDRHERCRRTDKLVDAIAAELRELKAALRDALAECPHPCEFEGTTPELYAAVDAGKVTIPPHNHSRCIRLRKASAALKDQGSGGKRGDDE